jgi:hypothetical protein
MVSHVRDRGVGVVLCAMNEIDRFVVEMLLTIRLLTQSRAPDRRHDSLVFDFRVINPNARE